MEESRGGGGETIDAGRNRFGPNDNLNRANTKVSIEPYESHYDVSKKSALIGRFSDPMWHILGGFLFSF